MVNILPAPPRQDPMERMLALFRVGMTVRAQKEAAEQNAAELKLRAQQLMQQAKAQKAEGERAALSALLRLHEQGSQNLTGGNLTLPDFQSEELSPLSGMVLQVLDAAKKAQNEKMVAGARTAGQEERMVIPAESNALQERIRLLQGDPSAAPAAGTMVDNRAMESIRSILGQSPDVGRANINLPGIVAQGQPISGPEISARMSQQGEAGTASRHRDMMALREKALAAKFFDPTNPEQLQEAESVYEQYRTGQLSFSAASRALGKSGFGAWLSNKAMQNNDVILPDQVRQGMAKMNNAESFIDNLERELEAAHAAGGLTKQKQLYIINNYVKSAAALLPQAFGDTGRLSDQDLERSMNSLPGLITSQSLDLALDQTDIIRRSIQNTRKDIIREYTKGYKKPEASGGDSSSAPVGTIATNPKTGEKMRKTATGWEKM